MKRIFLLLATNFAIMAVLSVAASVLGINRWLVANGINYQMLMGFALVWGMGGAFISLLMSKWIAKMSTGAKVITTASTPGEAWLLATVERQARMAGIGMPEVAVFPAPEPNAFATGANRNHALVAVSSGLLNTMDKDEVEAVLGHEISHVANGDMITLTLIQGVMNAFVIFAARVIGYAIDNAMRREGDRSGPGLGYTVIVMVLDIVLGVLAHMIVAWFSRQREFRADAGGARLAGKPKMVAALQRLSGAYGQSSLPKAMNAFGISGTFASLFATHPPLALRIERLQQSSAVIQ